MVSVDEGMQIDRRNLHCETEGSARFEILQPGSNVKIERNGQGKKQYLEIV
jgi:hypothetical protein